MKRLTFRRLTAAFILAQGLLVLIAIGITLIFDKSTLSIRWVSFGVTVVYLAALALIGFPKGRGKSNE
jgi:hypothetical protein